MILYHSMKAHINQHIWPLDRSNPKPSREIPSHTIQVFLGYWRVLLSSLESYIVRHRRIWRWIMKQGAPKLCIKPGFQLTYRYRPDLLDLRELSHTQTSIIGMSFHGIKEANEIVFPSYVKLLELWSNVPHWIRLRHNFDSLRRL